VNIDGAVEAASAATGAALGVGAVMRRYWTRREARQQAGFRQAVQDIVDASIADMIGRQVDFERRQGRHLDRQDLAIAALRRDIKQVQRRIDD
jgi:hypothetical protein